MAKDFKFKSNSKKNKQINLYEMYYYDPSAGARRKAIIYGGLPVIILVVVIIGLFTFFKVSDAIHNHEISKIQEYIDSPKVQSDYNESLDKQKELDELTKVFNEMNSAVEWRKNLSDMDADMMNTVMAALSGAKVTAYTYNSTDRTLVISASTKNAVAVPEQIRKLKATGDFSDVNYTGYDGDDGSYLFTVTCTLF